MFHGIVIALLTLVFGVSAIASPTTPPSAPTPTPNTANAAPIPNVPGAYHLLFVDSARLQMAAGSASILDQFDAHLIQKLSMLFPGARITPTTLANDQPPAIAQACAENQAIGLVSTLPGWGAKVGGFENTVSDLVAIFDCYGQIEWVSRKFEVVKPSNGATTVSDQQVISTLDDLSDQEVAEIRDKPGKYTASRRVNFLKYGYAIGDVERRPYFGLGRDPSGARVTFLTVFGSAARAGLKLGDLVTAINGQPTLGLSEDQLNLTRDRLMSPPNNYVLEVQAADGSKTTITFEAQDIGWYLTQTAVALSASPTPSPAQSIDPTTEQLKALVRAGVDARSNGDPKTALSKYQEALALARRVGNREYEARSLAGIGLADESLAQYADALSNLQQALALARQLGLHDIEGIASANIGFVYDKTGYYDSALAYARQAVVLDELNSFGDLPPLLMQVAEIEQSMGRLGDSLEASKAALAIATQRGDARWEAGARLDLGNVMQALSRFPEALTLYRAALDGYRELKNPDEQAAILFDMGLVQRKLGQYADAIETQKESIALAQQARNPETEAAALNQIGAVQEQLGLFQAALQSNGDALELQRKRGVPLRVAESLATRGTIELSLSAYDEAESYFRQALVVFKQIGAQTDIALDLENLGRVQGYHQQYAAALASYLSALAAFVKLDDRGNEATVLTYAADAQQQLGHFPDALASAQRSIALHRAIGSPAWHSLSAAAHAQASLGDPKGAISNYEAAIGEIEQLRGALPESGSRTAFFEQALFVYDDYITYLLDLDRRFPGKGYDRKALEVFERRQSRTLLEEISQSAAHGFSGVPRTVSDQEGIDTAEIAQLKTNLAQARSAGQTSSAKIASLETELGAVEQRRDALETRIRSQYPAYYALRHPQPISVSTLQQRVLRSGEAMLVYDVLGNRTALWVITPATFRLFDLEGGSADVQSKVVRFLSSTQSVQSAIDNGLSAAAVRRLAAQTLPSFADTSSALYQWLFPVGARSMIAASGDLYVVPTGALYGVPFEALATQAGNGLGVRYLVEDHSVSYLSSASLLAVLRAGLEKRRQGDQHPLVAFANPTFADTATPDPGASPTLATMQTRAVSRIVTRGAQSSVFPALPGSEIEAKNVATTIQGAAADIYVGDDASVATINRLNADGSLKDFRYVLFATHAALPDTISGIAQPSLVLAHPTSDGFLTMGDVFGLSLDAQLVMLSACESGGGTTTKGEGVQGLTQAFMYAGTPVVSVTQWEVVDDVAEHFTPDFFLRMHHNATPAQALRGAKLAMIHGSDAMLQHPFFWAPTVLFGDGALVVSR
jgi:CHAT domain-containing protein/tetratricopeptide (TPR) repeat protein